MGSHPSVVDWNNDGEPDLLVGDNPGCVFIYLNTGQNPDGTPILDSGAAVQMTTPGGEDLCVDGRAAAIHEDWNGDGFKDLLVGILEGGIRIYLNDGSDRFTYSTDVDASGWEPVPYAYQSRSSPRFFDWDGDGLKDLLVGVVHGEVWYFRNVTTDPENTPFVFDTAEKLMLADGVTELRYTVSGSAGPRSRLYVTDWNEDGLPDIVLGGNDGRLMLFLAENPVLEVAIDIKPGSDDNNINLGSQGVIPVAIFSSDTFDATTVDPETVTLEGAQIKMTGKSSKYLWHEEDVNMDGLMDIVCQVLTDQFEIETGETVAVLTAETFDGMQIVGEDTVNIVPDN
jgi:hypothetical protein